MPSSSDKHSPKRLNRNESLTWANMSELTDIDNTGGNAVRNVDPSKEGLGPTEHSVPMGNTERSDHSGRAATASTPTNGPFDVLRSPNINRLTEDEMKMFGSAPLTEELVLVQCKDCKKALLPSSFAEHVKYCGQKQARSQTASATTATVAKTEKPRTRKPSVSRDSKKVTSLSNGVAAATTGKVPEPNPVLAANAQLLNALKQKGMLKRKRTGPVDLKTQCGVLSHNNMPCTRPLSCRIHSTYEKSLVEGRESLSMDVLLLDYCDSMHGVVRNPAASSVNRGNIVVEEAIADDRNTEAVAARLRSRQVKPLVTVDPAQSTFIMTNCYRMRDLFMRILQKQKGVPTPVIPAPQPQKVNVPPVASTAPAPAPVATSVVSTESKAPSTVGTKAKRQYKKRATAKKNPKETAPQAPADSPLNDPRNLKLM